jgi:FAD/FMN-containing dehydrogenase
MVDVALLRSRVSGPVLTGDDPGFADEVRGWLLNCENTPEVAVGASSAQDVVEAVKFAVANGLPVRVQGTGHGAEVPITDGLLILTKRLETLSIDQSSRLATIGAGLEWDRVVDAAAPMGLAPIIGSSSTVGVVGFVLGGGLGPLARSHGHGSDWVRGFQVVTGDGELLSVDADNHPDLFWALRGGKGGLGVVTEVTVELIELPALYAGSLTFDAPNIDAALRAWATYTRTADPRVTTSAAIMRVPDLPFIPEVVRGHTLLALRFAFPGDAETGERLAAPLRAAAPVHLDALGVMGPEDMDTIHGDPKDPAKGWVSGRLLTSIDEELVETLLGIAGPHRDFPFVAVEVRHLGAATENDVPGGSAVSGRSGKGTLTLVGAPNPALFETVIPAAADAAFQAVSRWRSAENTVNFAPPPKTHEEFEAIWPADVFARLVEVRAQYDPKRTFVYGV